MTTEEKKEPTDTYKQALIGATLNADLVKNYDRLKGTGFGKMIVEMQFGSSEYLAMVKSGEAKKLMDEFAEFFDEFIWSRSGLSKY